jgi:AcrR family transcriptional regulator
VEAASGIAAESGVKAVTMTAVAERLGVAMPALYYHVSSRDELLGLLGASMLDEVALPDSDDIEWTDWLLTFARSLREQLGREPGLAAAPHLTAHGHLSVPMVERALGVLTRAGFTPEQGLVVFAHVATSVVHLVHQSHVVAEEAAQGRSQLGMLRSAAESYPKDEAPLLWQVLERWQDVPDDTTPDPDVRFEWKMAADIEAMRAVLEGRAPFPRLS